MLAVTWSALGLLAAVSIGLPTLLWSDLGAKMRGLAIRLDGPCTGLGGDMAELRNELGGDMAEVRNEFGGDMAELRTELGGTIANLRAVQKADFGNLDRMLDAQSTRIDGLQRDLSILRADLGEVNGVLYSIDTRVGVLEAA